MAGYEVGPVGVRGIPTLRPDFDTFLTARGNVALTRLKKVMGLNGVASLGVATVSGPSDEDGITVQAVAVRVQVGCPWNSQWGGRQDEYEAACLGAAHAALKIDGPQAYVGNVTVQDGGKAPTINLRTEVRTLTGDAGVTAEATATFVLRYRHLDAPEDVATGNPDDVVTDANGKEVYRWEL